MSRLIDADALVETLADQIKANESDTSASGMAAKEVLKGFIGLVNGQPTADNWSRYSAKLWKEAYERGKRDARPEVATDMNVPSTDCISRRAAVDLVKDVCDAIMSCCGSHYDEETKDEVYDDIREVDAILKCNKEIRIALKNMPAVQPDLPEAYAKKVWTWLLDYQTTAAELKAKYSAYEVLSWVVNDWRRGHGGLN